MIVGILEISLIYSIVALGIYITLSVINFTDLTIDSSFTIGGSVTALLLTSQYHPVIAIFASLFMGFIAGCTTGFMNTKYKISDILAGIITMTGCYSINLRILGKPNVPILDIRDIFAGLPPLVMICAISVFIYICTLLLLKTNVGLAARSMGKNLTFAKTHKVPIDRIKVMSVGIANGIVACAGSLLAQLQGYGDISMGTGTLVEGLAIIIIGQRLSLVCQSFWKVSQNVQILMLIVGAIIYKVAIHLAIQFSSGSFAMIQSYDLKLITAIVVFFAVTIGKKRA